MSFEGIFWLLWEDEPLSLETTRFFEFRDGKIFDGRTGLESGTFVETEQGVDALFDEDQGERELVKFRMSDEAEQQGGKWIRVTPPFDPEAEGYSLTFSNQRYEQYLQTRPTNDYETDEESYARKDREMEDYGLVPMHGTAYRDCVEVRQMGEENAHEAEVRLRREAITAV